MRQFSWGGKKCGGHKLEDREFDAYLVLTDRRIPINLKGVQSDHDAVWMLRCFEVGISYLLNNVIMWFHQGSPPKYGGYIQVALCESLTTKKVLFQLKPRHSVSQGYDS